MLAEASQLNTPLKAVNPKMQWEGGAVTVLIAFEHPTCLLFAREAQ